MSRIKNLPDAAPRLTVVDGSKLGIKTYGEDNGYPQRMLNLYNASGSAKMCANLCASYLIGKGFEDLDFYHAPINTKGLTPDKLLRRVANDKAKLRGFAIHVNYNAMYRISDVSYVPFEHCREGLEEHAGKIGLNKDWYNSKKGGSRRSKEDVVFVNRFNPDPAIIQKQVEVAGSWDAYRGQIYYSSDDFDTYPLATIDPVLDDVQAEIESAITRRCNLSNNFQLKHIWVEKGKPEDKKTDAEVVNEVREFMGSEGKPVSVVFSEDPEGKDIPTLIPVTSQMNDKLFQYTDQTARLAIYTAFGQPAILHSDYMGTNGYNEGQLPQSMGYYNAFTEPYRILFEEVFTEIFSYFQDNINPSGSYKITPLEAISATGSDINTENIDNRTLIEVIGIGGTQALTAILADTVTTPEQKKNALIIIFGLSEENASLLAGVTTGTATKAEE
jgi:hypothetical protein